MPTPYERLVNARDELLNRAAQAAAYDNWSNEFTRNHLRETWRNSDIGLRKPIEQITLADLLSLDEDERRNLGFIMWDDNLVLIPLWAWHYVVDDVELTNINGDTKIKGKDNIDLDVRFGCIAYGFKTR